jgi:AraC-like DNA-binding protein
MKTIQISSLSLNDVLSDISGHWDQSVVESCSEYTLELPEDIGKGKIKGISFDNGLAILIYDCTFKNDLKMEFNVNKVHPLKYIYALEGNLNHSFEKESEIHHIEQYKCAMVASSDHNGHELKFDANTPTKIISLEVNREKFAGRMLCELDDLNADLKSLFTDYRAKEKFHHVGHYSLKFQELFKALSEFEGKKLVRKMFLESKASDIFVNQIMDYEDDMKPNSENILRKSEMISLQKATDLIEDNIQDAPTVEELAREVGVNTNKLQDGFKYLYDKSVNQYLNDYRMDLAIEYLTETEMNITEICEEIGIASRSYFSKKFKERYNIKPSCLRKK